MTQKIENFVVAILDSITRKPIGTGFIVGDEYIITAYHVITDAIKSKANEKSQKKSLHIRFPSINKETKAFLLDDYSNLDYDIATLKLSSKISESLNIAIFGTSKKSSGNRFISSGYREVSGGAVGLIAPSELEPSRLPYPRLILRSDQIDKGMSGAPILDLEIDKVIGMIVATWYNNSIQGKDRQTAFGIPSEIIQEICPIIKMELHIEIIGRHDVNPRIFENLPSPRKHFVGRYEEKRLITDLMSKEGAKVFLIAMGGMGKTSLALEIAHKCLNDGLFRFILWIDAENNSCLSQILDTITIELCFKGFCTLNPYEKLTRVRKSRASMSGLIIIDRYEAIEDEALKEFLNKLPRSCRLLATSREAVDLDMSDTDIIRIRELDAQESADLIKKHSTGKRLENASTIVYREIYNACGGLPLALEWAIGQINSGRQTLKSVTQKISTVKSDIIYKTLFESAFKNFSDHEKRMLLSIAISIGSISKKAISYITEISRDNIDGTVEQLVDLCLIYDNGKISDENIRYNIHPLLSNFIRKKLEKDLVSQYTSCYIQFFSDLVEQNEYSKLEIAEIRATLDWCFQKDPNRFIDLIFILSYYFYNEGLWDERFYRAQQALEISKKYKNQKVEIWVLVNELGYMSIQQNEYSKAKEFLTSGLKKTQTAIDVMSADDLAKDASDNFGYQYMEALAFRYFGILYSSLSQLQKANNAFKKAILLFKKLKRNTIIANQQIEMAELALTGNNQIKAEKLFNQAIAYHSSQMDEKPFVIPWLARAYYGLGDIRSSNKNYDQAKDLYIRALNLAKTRESEKDIANAHFRLAFLENNLGNSFNALIYARKSLNTFYRLGNIEAIDRLEILIESLNG